MINLDVDWQIHYIFHYNFTIQIKQISQFANSRDWACNGINYTMKEMVGGCCVCSDERGWPDNPLVYCDGNGCNVAVHQACYGIVTVPIGPWFCRKCESPDRQTKVVSWASSANAVFYPMKTCFDRPPFRGVSCVRRGREHSNAPTAVDGRMWFALCIFRKCGSEMSLLWNLLYCNWSRLNDTTRYTHVSFSDQIIVRMSYWKFYFFMKEIDLY